MKQVWVVESGVGLIGKGDVSSICATRKAAIRSCKVLIKDMDALGPWIRVSGTDEPHWVAAGLRFVAATRWAVRK